MSLAAWFPSESGPDEWVLNEMSIVWGLPFGNRGLRCFAVVFASPDASCEVSGEVELCRRRRLRSADALAAWDLDWHASRRGSESADPRTIQFRNELDQLVRQGNGNAV